MKNTAKRKSDAIEALAYLQERGIVSPESKIRQEVLKLIVKQPEACSPGGTKDLINNQTDIVAGISSFNNKAFGRTAIVHAIRVRGNSAALSGESAVAIENADFATSTIAIGVRNSDLTIKQGQDLFTAPVRSLLAQAAATSIGGDEYEFDKPLIFTPDVPVNFVMSTPPGVSVPTTGYFLIELEVSLVVGSDMRDSASKKAC